MRQQSSIDQEQFVELAIKSRNQNVQRIFRDGLFTNNKHRCPLCGFEYKDFLIASHIVPYSKCEDTYDAINYYNGLLLCPNHDKLFEGARLMTIDASTGRVILSDKVVNSKDFKDLQVILTLLSHLMFTAIFLKKMKMSMSIYLTTYLRKKHSPVAMLPPLWCSQQDSNLPLALRRGL